MTKLFSRSLKQSVAFSALTLIVAGGVAYAAPTGASTDQGGEHRGHGPGRDGKRFDPFARFDQDGDGKIALKDLPARAQTHLGSADANKDGILTRDEFKQGRPQMRAEFEKRADANHDGKVTPEERQAMMQTHFEARFNEDDKNHDGTLTADEVGKQKFEHLTAADTNHDAKVTKAEIQEAFKSGAMGPHRGGPEGRHAKGHGPQDPAERQAKAMEHFKRMDANNDGFLTQTEAPKRWDHLKVADANNDSKVTLAEMKAAFESGKLGHRGGPGARHGAAKGTGAPNR